MDKINFREFSITQPDYPNIHESDVFYVELANGLMESLGEDEFSKKIPSALLKRISLTLTDYLQDIVSDSGLWRSFIIANRSLYGRTLPFYDISENYIDFELNKEDVYFLVWYVVSNLWEEMRFIHPKDKILLQFAHRCFLFLESKYEEAPVPEHFNIARGLEFTDPEDKDKIFNLGNWLFLHSYLLTPAFSITMREMAADLNPDDPDFGSKLNKRLEKSMMNDTTGPLALFTPEWVYLLIEGKLPPEPSSEEGKIHKYYELFTKATEGRNIIYFDSYEKMNDFFINALGWQKGEEHLAQLKGENDFILMVNKEKGMLVAINIAKCVNDPNNPLYDKSYAKQHAFELLSERGKCPGDLLREILKNNWLPDAHFPGSEDYEIVNRNADFISRNFLQLYYRGD